MKQMQRSKEKHRRSGHFGGADTARLVRLLGTNFTNPETVLRLEYEGGQHKCDPPKEGEWSEADAER